MTPYHQFVNQFVKALEHGKTLPLGAFPMPQVSPPSASAPKALIFSPHPDDEVIVGGLPLRLGREVKMNVLNVAVTQGSNKARQAGRWQELTNCCQYLGWGLLQTQPGGLEGINLKTRTQNPAQWSESVKRIAEILSEQKPRLIFFPNPDDWNSSHIGTHFLVMDALQQLGAGFSCLAIETEYWGAMSAPNLMVESSEQEVGDLITGLTFHVGEVQRNPYHLGMPAWMIDNVRRGAELVGGQGGVSPNFTFATLYRVRAWRNGKLENVYEGGKFLGRNESPGWLLQ